MPDAPTPLDLDAIRAVLDRGVAATGGEWFHALRSCIDEVERLRAKVDRLMGVLEPYTREYPRVCNRLVAAENERDAALAEVARLTARPALAWDEDVVRAEVDCEALRRFVDSFCDDEAGEVEHVVSADGTSGFAFTGGNDAHAVLRKAASALWPGESRATVQAEALREAGQDLPGEWSKQERRKVERWLRDRADRLAAEGGAS